MQTSGAPLDAATRRFMEPRFGHDFSRIRVHTDARASASADAVHARAYTVGSNVSFAADEYAPTTARGRNLIAHELAHTIQQSGGAGASTTGTREGHEREADAAANAINSGATLDVSTSRSAFYVARKPADDKERAAAVAEIEAMNARMEHDRAEEEQDEDAKTGTGRPGLSTPASSPPIPPAADPERILQEAQGRLKLASMALALAERQARRHAFWDGNPSNNTADVKEAFTLDLYWDPNQNGFVRQPYVSAQEDLVAADPDARRLYSDHLWGLTENRQPEKSLPDRLIGFVCKHTEPCSSNQEHTRRDIEGGMSREEATKRASARLLLFGAMLALPGEGPSGPVQVGPRGMPGAGPALIEPAVATPPSGAAEELATPTSDPVLTTGGKSGGPGRGGQAPVDEGATPEVTEDAPTAPIPTGTPPPGELVGEFRITGSKGLKGKTFEREIWGIRATEPVTTKRGLGPVLKLFDDLIGEARAAGATELRVVGKAVTNKYIVKMRRTIEARGGRFTRVDARTVEIVLPVPK
jgi:hypothetical protein